MEPVVEGLEAMLAALEEGREPPELADLPATRMLPAEPFDTAPVRRTRRRIALGGIAAAAVALAALAAATPWWRDAEESRGEKSTGASVAGDRGAGIGAAVDGAGAPRSASGETLPARTQASDLAAASPTAASAAGTPSGSTPPPPAAQVPQAGQGSMMAGSERVPVPAAPGSSARPARGRGVPPSPRAATVQATSPPSAAGAVEVQRDRVAADPSSSSVAAPPPNTAPVQAAVDAPALPPVATPAAPPARNAGADYVAPKLLTRGASVYPEAARRRHFKGEGRVQVRVLIDEQGQVLNVLALDERPPQLGFAAAAREAARRSTFAPATRNGVPGVDWVELTFVFHPP
jgi:TonB family protein